MWRNNLQGLCECGCGAEVKYRFKRGHMMRDVEWQRRAGKLGGRPFGFFKPGSEPTQFPTAEDIAWAAGIYEGEGSCSFRATIQVFVTQKERELCDWLRDLFGGGVCLDGEGYHHWYISGKRASGFLAVIYKYLTNRRKGQVDAVLAGWFNKFPNLAVEPSIS